MKSIFTEKTLTPTSAELEKALGATFLIWKDLENFTTKTAPFTLAEWNFSGEKFGWSYRIKDKKRVLIYLLCGTDISKQPLFSIIKFSNNIKSTISKNL
ncbi:DUF3788 family protein [Chryseobacterium sp.]|uniref:DUF3788 family protein n=1 Tax=Chryseobacterium sp. TaxID=1871047 RepID=UPI0011C8B8D9|nr:DUF3788 family protein [Chryseobacterium sp.]TXF79047.1 DUF3788 family protein [Chryseobacterium sp.]